MGGDRLDCNLPERPAVMAACPSAVDNDCLAYTLLCGPAVHAAFALSEAVTRTEAESIPKRDDASLLGQA